MATNVFYTDVHVSLLPEYMGSKYPLRMSQNTYVTHDYHHYTTGTNSFGFPPGVVEIKVREVGVDKRVFIEHCNYPYQYWYIVAAENGPLTNKVWKFIVDEDSPVGYYRVREENIGKTH